MAVDDTKTSFKCPVTPSLQELNVNLQLLYQKVRVLERSHIELEKSEQRLTKTDLLLVHKDISSLTISVSEIKESLIPLKDYSVVRKICFTGVGMILLGVMTLAGNAIIGFLKGG